MLARLSSHGGRAAGPGPAGRGRRVRAAARLAGAVLAAAGLCAVTALPAQADAVRDQEMWVLDMVHAPSAWPVTQGQGVLVAVIDSGVSGSVSDLAGSVTQGPNLSGVSTPESNASWGVHGTWMASLIAGHGHGDGSAGIEGVAPQSRVLSIRVVTDRGDPNFGKYEQESNASWGVHGTWMASLIAGHGHGDGSAGIEGVAPQSRVLSIRVVTDRGDPNFGKYEQESNTQVQRALARAITIAARRGADVISMSLGYGAASRPVRVALQNAEDHGVVVVASSGNSGDTASALSTGQAPYSFPADYPGVLGVGAVTQAGTAASFSSNNLSVEIAAPGVKVPAQGRDGQYWLVSGTSPACALTAGVAALIKSRYPHLSPALVDQAITSTAQNRPPRGYDDRVGFGTVDAAAALSAAATLTRDVSTGRGVKVATHFGGGTAAVPQVPVSPRGSGRLILYAVLVLACLVIVAFAVLRLIRRRSPAAVPADEPWQENPPWPGKVQWPANAAWESNGAWQTPGTGAWAGNGTWGGGLARPGNGSREANGTRPGGAAWEADQPRPGSVAWEGGGPRPGNGAWEGGGPRPGNGSWEDYGPRQSGGAWEAGGTRQDSRAWEADGTQQDGRAWEADGTRQDSRAWEADGIQQDGGTWEADGSRLGNGGWGGNGAWEGDRSWDGNGAWPGDEPWPAQRGRWPAPSGEGPAPQAPPTLPASMAPPAPAGSPIPPGVPSAPSYGPDPSLPDLPPVQTPLADPGSPGPPWPPPGQ